MLLYNAKVQTFESSLGFLLQILSSFYVRRPPLPSDLSGPNQYVDYVSNPTSPESVESSIASPNPTKMAEDLDER